MKIALLTPFFPSSILSDEEIKKYGLKHEHPYTWIKNLAESLAQIPGVNIHVVTMCNKFFKDMTFVKGGVLYNFLKPKNKYLRVLSFFYTDKKQIHTFLRKEKFDVVHGQGMNSYGYYAVTSKLPHVLTVHLFEDNPFKEIFTSKKISGFTLFYALLTYLQQKILFKKAKTIISISPFIKQKLLEINKHYSIHEIGNAVSQIFFDEQISKKYTTNNNYVLYVGSICHRKSILELLEAIKITKEVKLKIVSFTNSGSYYNEVIKYIEENELSNRIELLGAAYNEKITEIIQGCSFLVLFSKQETSPMVIAEAMASGKPVIASNIDGIPFMIEDNKTGFLVEANNIKQLSEKMNTMMSNNELRLKMGGQAKKYAEKMWYPDMIAFKTLSVYKSILD